MSITHVNHEGCSSYGCLVRAYVSKGRELSQFLAYAKNGGVLATTVVAEKVEKKLKAKAKRIRRGNERA